MLFQNFSEYLWKQQKQEKKIAEEKEESKKEKKNVNKVKFE